MTTLLEYIPTEMKRVASTNGGEWHGPCPWCGGKDRFHVNPFASETGLFVCNQCKRGGDGIDLVRELHGAGYQEARQRLGMIEDGEYSKPAPAKAITEEPPRAWSDAAWSFAEECEARLWTNEGTKALEWLRGRGLTDEVIKRASFGFNPDETYLPAPAWGIDRGIKIERGITIPWVIGGKLWKLNVRRAAGNPKYKCVTGSKNALYEADGIKSGRPAVLVEGEIDAWSIVQSAYDIAWAVATGSTHGSRRAKWTARLMTCSVVLAAFDSDKPGEDAAKYWTETLPNAVRWRPYWGDANEMLAGGADVRAWIQAGISQRQPIAA